MHTFWTSKERKTLRVARGSGSVLCAQGPARHRRARSHRTAHGLSHQLFLAGCSALASVLARFRAPRKSVDREEWQWSFSISLLWKIEKEKREGEGRNLDRCVVCIGKRRAGHGWKVDNGCCYIGRRVFGTQDRGGGGQKQMEGQATARKKGITPPPVRVGADLPLSVFDRYSPILPPCERSERPISAYNSYPDRLPSHAHPDLHPPQPPAHRP